MQASQGLSTILAHDRPALSESSVSARRLLLELRERPVLGLSRGLNVEVSGRNWPEGRVPEP